MSHGFLQATILVAGLMVFKDHALLGLGLMLSAGESPPYRRCVRAGYHHAGQYLLGCLHSTECGQYGTDGGGRGEMRIITMGSLFDGIGAFRWRPSITALCPLGQRDRGFPHPRHTGAPAGDAAFWRYHEAAGRRAAAGGHHLRRQPCQDLSVAGSEEPDLPVSVPAFSWSKSGS